MSLMTRPLTLFVTSGLLNVVCFTMLISGDRDASQREFFKPPSPCLTGPSCRNCVNTMTFQGHEVCCYHCRLDNVVILGDTYCHCVDTRLPDSLFDVGGNCSSGEICSNCAVTISRDDTQTLDRTPGVTDFCCQDCGLVVPYLNRDEKGCHCAGDSQGLMHKTVPRFDPSKQTTTISAPNTGNTIRTCVQDLNFIFYVLLSVLAIQYM